MYYVKHIINLMSLYLFIKTDISFSKEDISIIDNDFISSVWTFSTKISTRVFDDNFCIVFETVFNI